MPVEVPTGWSHARFGDVMTLLHRRETIDPARIYRLLGVRWYGNGAFLRENRLGDGLSAQHIYPVQSGDVIYNRLFAWKGSFGLVGDDLAGCHVSNEFPLFSARLDRVDPQFLLRILRLPRTAERADAFSTGTTSISRNRLAEEDFLSFPLALPPLPEQRAISEVLRATQSAIEKMEILIEASDRATRTLLQSFFLEHQKSLRWSCIGSLGHWKSGGTPATAVEANWNGSFPWVCPKDIKGPTVASTIDQISQQAAEALGIVEPGTLLVVVRGMILVRAVPTTICEVHCAFNQDVKAFVPKPGVSAAFLKLWLDINETKLLAEVETATHGTKRFPLSKLNNFPVPELSGDTQERLVSLAESNHARLRTERAELAARKATYFALSQELLSGRMRLPDSMIARHRDNPGQAA